MIETLKAYQAWRCGDDERTLEDTGLTPAIIGEAIDWAMGVAEERDALGAQVEQLREATYDAYWSECDRVAALSSILESTPAQCLAEHDAQVVEDVASNLFNGGERLATTIRMILFEHANHIRQQVKENT